MLGRVSFPGVAAIVVTRALFPISGKKRISRALERAARVGETYHAARSGSNFFGEAVRPQFGGVTE